MNYKPVKFSRTISKEFHATLRKRVNSYFKDKGISTYGNYKMVIKTIVIFAMYAIPFAFVASGAISNTWLYFGAWFLMGTGVAAIGMGIMHDAAHGSYSKNPTVNKIVAYVLNVAGGYVTTWKVQHNRLHHSFTNIDGHDHDIDAGDLLRFSPNQKRHFMHRFQFLYAWFFYGLMTISWITAKDFKQMKEFKEKGFLGQDQKKYRNMMVRLVLLKISYYAVTLGLPLIFAPFAWWITLLGFLMMHFVAGIILSSVFQLAHVMPECEFPIPDDENYLEENWAVHQLQTTANFSPKSRIMSWFLGGLNYQIEHHLFPNICHIHYPKISEIVKKTANEYNIPYHEQPTFVHALFNHTKLLYALGNKD